MTKILWLGWGLLSAMLIAYFGYKIFFSDNKSEFVIGEATHGHHQIELACETCHTDSFGGPEVLQDACTNCHGQDLTLARDEHPKKKFTNPRNAALIEILDARQCISCHTEHQAEQTHPMGVTLPTDYCFHCHQEVGENRASHKDLPFDSCANSGCHNFHDNRALYEDFLVGNAGQPWLQQISLLAAANHAKYSAPHGKGEGADAGFAEKAKQHPDVHESWAMSAHATANVQCANCHVTQSPQGDGVLEDNGQPAWIAKPAIDACESCHSDEVTGFTSGKHGMRLSPLLSKSLSPMTPALARLEFHEDSQHRELTCNSCHDVHELNTQFAAADGCLDCHSDDHSSAFKQSPHGQLWEKELAEQAEPGSGVSCATCHMPRLPLAGFADAEKTIKEYRVQHNQNDILRPNEKMIRPVCMQCHSLEFSIDALADEALIRNNFSGKPAKHVESIDWAVKRVRN